MHTVMNILLACGDSNCIGVTRVTLCVLPGYPMDRAHRVALSGGASLERLHSGLSVLMASGIVP